MITHISEIIHEWTDWCPGRVQSQKGNRMIPPDDISVAPADGGSFKERAVHWIGLFRNQIILSSLAMLITGFWMFAGLGGGSGPGVFILGIVAGSPLTAITGIWYWRIFNEVLCEGPVILMNRRDRTTRTISALSLPVVIIPVLVLFGLLPGVTMEMMIAFMGGFVAVLFWGIFIALQRWESVTHHRLHYDGMILEMETEEMYAIL